MSGNNSCGNLRAIVYCSDNILGILSVDGDVVYREILGNVPIGGHRRPQYIVQVIHRHPLLTTVGYARCLSMTIANRDRLRRTSAGIETGVLAETSGVPGSTSFYNMSLLSLLLDRV